MNPAAEHTQEHSLEPLYSPRSFGPKYVLLRKIAEGGMAEIFLAKQLGAHVRERTIVIKRMRAELGDQHDFVQLFLHEARLASQLLHPNVVEIWDVGLEDGHYFLAMEYLPGEDLAMVLRDLRLRQRVMPVDSALHLFAQVADGLDFAHGFRANGKPMNVVHRDVSPGNVFLTYDGRVKLLDFGIAKAESRAIATDKGVVRGKFMYVAPEQARGEPVDRRSDVFAAGVCLYEALTGVRPFEREGQLAVLKAITAGQFRPPRELRKDLSPGVEKVVLRAMALDPRDRFPTAGAFGAALREHLVGADAGEQLAALVRQLAGQGRVSARSEIPSLEVIGFSGSSAQRPRARGKWLGGKWLKRAGGLVGVILLALAIALLWPRGNPRSSEPEDVPPPVVDADEEPAPVESEGDEFIALAGPVEVHRDESADLGGEEDTRAEPPTEEEHSAPTPPGLKAPTPRTPTAKAAHAPAQRADTPGAKTGTRTPAPRAVTKAPAAPHPTGVPVSRRKLSQEDVSRVVSANKAALLGCFREANDAPKGEGALEISFAVLSSGKVSRPKVRGVLAQTQVGRCVERKLAALRFPAHAEDAVPFDASFKYRLR